jgi:3-phenylpropionate/cinnamic acid dioxygenase small subunit
MDSRTEIERLIFHYAERIDAGDFEGVADLLANAVVKASGGVVADGRAAVLRMYEASTRRYEDGTPHTKHVTTNVIVEIDASGAAIARSYFTVLQSLPDFPLQVIIAGRYHDRFALKAGEWRFTERDIIVDLHGDLSRHLLIQL